MNKFRSFEERRDEYCELKGYTLIADEIDFLIFEDVNGERIYCSGSALHWTMLSEGIV